MRWLVQRRIESARSNEAGLLPAAESDSYARNLHLQIASGRQSDNFSRATQLGLGILTRAAAYAAEQTTKTAFFSAATVDSLLLQPSTGRLPEKADEKSGAAPRWWSSGGAGET